MGGDAPSPPPRCCQGPYAQVFQQSPGLKSLLLSYLLVSVVYSLGIQLYGPFLRSLVVCEEVARPWERFSGSAHCGNSTLVLSVAQEQEGRLVSMKLLVHAAAGPCLGAMADRRGRRPVLLLSLGGFTAAFLLLAVTARRPWQTDRLVFAVFFLEGATNAFDVVYMSMVADLTTAATRATAFAAYLTCSAAGQVAAQLLAVAILHMSLASYSGVWLGLSGVLALDVLLVQCSVSESLTSGGQMKKPAREGAGLIAVLAEPFELVLSEPFLRRWLLAVLLASLAAGLSSIHASFSIAVYGWRPGDLQAYTWCSQLLRVGSLSLLSSHANRWGSPPSIVLLQVLLTVTAGMVQIFAPLSPAALLAPLYMVDAMAFAGSANAAFLSMQFSAEQQAKVHAVQHLCSNLGTSLSIALFSSPLLFRPELRGLPAMRPFLLASLLGCSAGAAKARLALAYLEEKRRAPASPRVDELERL